VRDATARHFGTAPGAPPLWLAGPSGRLRFRLFWLVTLGLLGLAIALTTWYAPIDPDLGPIQKLFYFHLSVAIGTFLACLASFAGSVGYLWQREAIWDALGASGARAAVALCAVVLLTGVFWAKQAWGVWWEWNPPLTFSLSLFALYIGYVALRRWLADSERRSGVCAVYGIIAFFNVPLVYVSAKLLPDSHPSSLELTAPMRLTLVAWLVAVAALTVGLIGTGIPAGAPAERDDRP